MMHRSHRFHGRTSLHFVYRHGQVVRGAQLALKYARNTRRAEYRVAVVVSRKVHKSAVVRNRIRRRIYETVRTLSPNIRQPYDLVFTVYSDQLATMESSELRQCVQTQLSKAGVLHAAQAGPQ